MQTSHALSPPRPMASPVMPLSLPRRIHRKVTLIWRNAARSRLRRRVAFTAPSPPCASNLSFSPHALVCRRDLLLTICSAKSLNLAMQTALPWTFHDDGSLRAPDVNLVMKQFPGCRLISRQEADRFYESKQEAWPALCKLRRESVMILKLADLGAFAGSERVLYVDSDILFFRPPDFMVTQLEAGRHANCFNRDVATVYIAPSAVIAELTGVVPPPRINAGLSILNRRDISLDRINDVLTKLDKSQRSDWGAYDHLIEQTAVAVLAASSGNEVVHFPKEYDVAYEKQVEDCIARHYVGPIRDLFELQGLRHLIYQSAFLDRWAAFARS